VEGEPERREELVSDQPEPADGLSFPPPVPTITDDILHVSVNLKGTGKR
jgi:hypothetical protein